MKNTFVSRVAAERKVLKVINGIVPKNQQLAGLSAPAIDNWKAIVQLPSKAATAEILFALSKSCQLFSSRSGENFKSMDLGAFEKYELLLKELQNSLEAQFPQN